MRPIPAPRLGDAHGLLRAIGERDRIRLDEFVTEFSVEELFPPGLENALGRTRQFISFARSAGLLNEDRGTVELTDMGKRYVRAGDSERPFDVAPAQAEWLRRLLRERHMTDSIYHGAAIGLSLCASNPPGFRASSVDFGRALNQLGRAGWDSENTFQSQGERYTTFLRDLELIDGERRLTPTGQQARDELTLPIHMSLKDLAGQLNPGGAEAAAHEGEAEFAAAQAPPPEPEPVAAPAGEDEYEDVGPGAGPSPAAAPAPVAAGPPTPPEDIWESGPGDRTQAYRAVGVEPPAVETPVPAEAAPATPTADAPVEGTPAAGHSSAPAASAVDAPVEAASSGAAAPSHTASPVDSPVEGTPSAPLPDGAPAGAPLEPPSSVAPAGGAPAAAPLEPPSSVAPAGRAPAAAPFEPGPGAGPSLEELAGAATVASSAAPPAPAVSANAIAAAARDAGLRLPAGVYAAVAAALAGGHVVLVGPAGCGKTTLALAVAKAAAQAGQSGGATLVTAAQRWSNRDTVGRPRDEEWERGVVVDAAARGRWLVIDEIGRARLDRALGELSSFLGGSPVALPDGESEPSPGWRVVATSTSALEGSPALVRRFAHVYVPPPHDTDLALAIGAAAGSDTAAAAAIRRLIPAREIGPIGTGAFLDAARFAAHRNAASPADEATLAREALAAHIAPVLGRLDQDARARLWALAG